MMTAFIIGDHVVTKYLTFLFISFIVFSAYAKRKELTISELESQYPTQLVGKVISQEKNVFSVLVLKEKTNSVTSEIKVDGENPQQKPNENPQVGSVYLFFLKKKNSGNYEIGRSVEVQDYLISDEEMKFKAIKTDCFPISAGCIFQK